MNGTFTYIMLTMMFALAGAASGQSKVATAPDSSAPGSLASGIAVTGSLRSRVEGFDWFEPTSGSNAYAYSGNILRIRFSQTLETWDWSAEFAAPFLLGLPSNAAGPGAQGALGLGSNYFTANSGSQNTAMIFPKQLYARFTQFGTRKASSLKIGRFEFQDGSETSPKNATLANLKLNRVNQRLIGSFGWSDVGRSFDGIQYSYSKPGGTLTFMGAVPTRGVFQVDGWGWNKAAVGYTSFAKPWQRGVHAAETRLFAIYYDDWRRGVVKTDNRPLALRSSDFSNLRIWTVGGNSLHLFDTKKGAFDALIWGAVQGGDWGVQTQSAYAIDAEAGYQPEISPNLPPLAKLKPWFRGGYSVASGDDNPADGSHGTFFQILPTPRPYARFPFFNMMNNIDRFGSLTLRPHAKVTVSSEFHSLSLQSAKDLWYAGGGVFQPWTFGYQGRNTSGAKSLGNLYDTSVEYRYNARVTFTAYLGYVQGLAAMRQIYPAGKDGAFGYGEMLYRF